LPRKGTAYDKAPVGALLKRDQDLCSGIALEKRSYSVISEGKGSRLQLNLWAA
jgi:hypothetical protein